MKHIALVILITAFASSSAFAQSCATKAMSKDGKPLAGAAKNKFRQEVLRRFPREQGWQTVVWRG